MFMALAKLLFRDDQKELSLSYCESVINKYLEKLKEKEQDEEDDDVLISKEDAMKAYYLAGWIKIHDDNHTDAYQIWSNGHRAIPSCPVLMKQNRKRECWDQDPSNMEEWLSKVELLVENVGPTVFCFYFTLLLMLRGGHYVTLIIDNRIIHYIL
jgi:hypothetical protein